MSLSEKNITDEQFYKQFEKHYQSLTLTGKAPWLKEGKIERDIAFNPNSGVIFKGINGIMLEMSAAENNFKEAKWLSESEIADLKLHVRAGQLPTPIAYVNKYSHVTDVHPSTGKEFNKDHPKQKYYYMYNIQQLKEYEKIKENSISIEKVLIEEKIQNVIENTKTKDFNVILEMVSETAQNKTSEKNAKIVAQEITRYRMTQEFKGKYIPKIPIAIMKDASLKTKGTVLLGTVYHAEVTKDRFISKEMNLENDKIRTVTRTRQHSQAMSWA